MELYTLLQAAALVIAGFAAALTALAFMAPKARAISTHAEPSAQPEVVFLFEDDKLVDASPAGHRLLDVTASRGNDILRLVTFLSPRFPELHDRVMDCEEADHFDLTSSDGQTLLSLHVGSGRLRITLTETADAATHLAPDRHSQDALIDELRMYRSLGNGTPFPIWRQTEDGRVTWANAEYCHLADSLQKTSPGALWPQDVIEIDPVLAADLRKPQTIRIKVPNEKDARWYECQTSRIGGDLIVAAIPIDRAIRAERTSKEFVQTLTQTFAHLSVGLAIFNRSRELAIFNPALTELLNLPPEFLIKRPTLFQVLDKLRTQQLIPEPPNTKPWSQYMAELETAAADGAYCETWSLIDGRTYKVTGRPHPEGAVAFLIEDISAEISTKLQFRSELQLSRAVLDGLGEAIAVFTPAGEVEMWNRAYAEMWHPEGENALDKLTITEASRAWQQGCAPTPIWGDVRDFAATLGERSNWTADARLRNGNRLGCRFEALNGGHTLVGFSDLGAVVATNPTLQLRPGAQKSAIVG